MGLSPFEVINADLEDVFNLYVDCIIHARREKGQNSNDEWVTSKNATWH